MDLSVITELGFPIFIALFLLLRFERKVEALTTAIHELMKSFEETKKTKLPLRNLV